MENVPKHLPDNLYFITFLFTENTPRASGQWAHPGTHRPQAQTRPPPPQGHQIYRKLLRQVNNMDLITD